MTYRLQRSMKIYFHKDIDRILWNYLYYLIGL